MLQYTFKPRYPVLASHLVGMFILFMGITPTHSQSLAQWFSSTHSQSNLSSNLPRSTPASVPLPTFQPSHSAWLCLSVTGGLSGGLLFHLLMGKKVHHVGFSPALACRPILVIALDQADKRHFHFNLARQYQDFSEPLLKLFSIALKMSKHFPV